MFGPLIQRFLLDNNHKVTVELLPDTKLGAIVEADEKKRLQVRSNSWPTVPSVGIASEH